MFAIYNIVEDAYLIGTNFCYGPPEENTQNLSKQAMLAYQTLQEAKRGFNRRCGRNPDFRIVRLSTPAIEEVLEFDFTETPEGRHASDAYNIGL